MCKFFRKIEVVVLILQEKQLFDLKWGYYSEKIKNIYSHLSLYLLILKTIMELYFIKSKSRLGAKRATKQIINIQKWPNLPFFDFPLHKNCLFEKSHIYTQTCKYILILCVKFTDQPNLSFSFYKQNKQQRKLGGSFCLDS